MRLPAGALRLAATGRGALAAAALLLGLSSGGPAAAAQTTYRLHTDATGAARLIARFERARLVLVGASPERLDATLTPARSGAEAALRMLGQRAGLDLVRRRRTWWMAPPARLRRALLARRSLSGGRSIDLDLHRADGRALLWLLADVSRLRLRGHVEGEVTLVGAGFGARGALHDAAALLGAAPRRVGRTVLLGGDEELARPAPPADAADGGDRCAATRAGALLPCVRVEALSLGATVTTPAREPAALLEVTGSADRPVIVHVGDRVGATAARVGRIAAEEVELEAGAAPTLIRPR